MGIWNTGASPIGYAYQSAKSSGINIKAIDPRAFQVDSGYSQSSGKSSSSGSEEKYKAQMGTRTQLENLDLYFDNQKEVLQKTYTEKILSENNDKNVLSLQNSYVSELNQLTAQKMKISVLKQNAEFSYDQQKKVDEIIYNRKINHDVALEENLATVLSGAGIVNMFRRRRSPVTYDVNNDKILTYEERQDYINRNSGVYTDSKENLQITDYKAPILKISNSDEANAEIKSIVKGADGNFTKGYSLDTPLGGNSSDYSDNQGSLNEVVDNIWDAVSEDTKNYAYSAVLGIGIIYETGKKIPVVDNKGKKVFDKKGKLLYENELADPISGEDAVKRISFLVEKSDKLKNDDPEKEKLLNEANRIGKGIMNTAKGYVRDMAIGDTAGLRKVVNKSSQTIKEDKDGNGAGATEEATEFMALMQTAFSTDQNLYYNVKGVDKFGKLVNKNGSPTTKGFNLNEDAKLYQMKGLFGVYNLKELKNLDMSLNDMPGSFMFNGIYVDRDIISAEDQSKIKLKGIGSSGYILPQYYNPTQGDKISTEIKQTKGGQLIQAPYIELEYTTEDGNIELPVYEKNKIVYKRISEISNKAIPTGYNIKENNGVYEFTVLKEGTNPYSGTKNTIHAGLIANQLTTAESESARPFIQKQRYEMQQKRINDITASSGVKYAGELYGKLIERDPKIAFEKISSNLKGNKNYDMQILQAIDDVWESADINERDKYREDLIEEYKLKTKKVLLPGQVLTKFRD